LKKHLNSHQKTDILDMSYLSLPLLIIQDLLLEEKIYKRIDFSYAATQIVGDMKLQCIKMKSHILLRKLE